MDTNNSRSFGIASLVLGILGLITACIPVLGLVLGVIGLVLGIVGFVKLKGYSDGRNLIIAALVISILSVIIGLTWSVFLVNKAKESNIMDMLDEVNFDDGNMNWSDTTMAPFDSLKMTDEDLENLEKTMDDIHNSPGKPPVE